MLRFTMVYSITGEADIVNGSNTKVIRNLFSETQKHVKHNIYRKLDALEKFEKNIVKTICGFHGISKISEDSANLNTYPTNLKPF